MSGVEPKRVSEALRDAARMFEQTSDSARLDAELIMAYQLGVSRSQMLLTRMDAACPEGFLDNCKRRMAQEPVAYILGEQEFFGLPFKVGPGVLIPRSDSEVLVETALDLVGEIGSVLDLGTGSGALLLAFLANRPGWSGVGVDQSSEALQYASQNAERLGQANCSKWLRFDWRKSDLAELAASFDLILCNPPYVETDAALARDVKDYEPASALFAGADGLDDYRILIPRIRELMRDGAVAIFEIGATQADAVGTLAKEHGFSPEIRKDLANRPRAVVLR